MGIDNYRRRTLKDGLTNKDRTLKKMRDAYEKYLNISPEANEVYIDGVEYTFILQDRRAYDPSLPEKFMITPHDIKFDVGTYVYTLGEVWIVDSIEIEVVEQHVGHRLMHCDNVLKWQDEKGVIYEYPCSIMDKTSVYSDGLSKSQSLVTSIYQSQATVPIDKNTMMIDTDDRFIFNHTKYHVYSVTRLDFITSPGLLMIVMKRDDYDKEKDDLEKNLSVPITMNSEENTITPKNDIEDIGKRDPIILGNDSIAIYDDYSIYSMPNQTGVVWEVDENYLEILETDDNRIKLRAKGKLGKTSITGVIDSQRIVKNIKIVFTR